jgi:hypothetical protein
MTTKQASFRYTVWLTFHRVQLRFPSHRLSMSGIFSISCNIAEIEVSHPLSLQSGQTDFIDLSSQQLVLLLIEELLDSQSISGCRTVFSYLESRREAIIAVRCSIRVNRSR